MTMRVLNGARWGLGVTGWGLGLTERGLGGASVQFRLGGCSVGSGC